MAHVKEHLLGTGDVHRKDTGELLASGVRYALTVLRSAGGRLGRIDAHVGLDPALARRSRTNRELLTLLLQDRRRMDFFVSGVDGPGGVRVRPTGGLRPRNRSVRSE